MSAPIAYNVTAINQNDSQFSGPAYLVNALSNRSIWYQVGVFIPALYFLNSDTFTVGYQTWNSSGVIQSGSIHLPSQINNDDNIQLSIAYRNNFVVLTVHDWNSTSVGTAFLPTDGPVNFVGSSNKSPFFTGPMTEWYRANPYFSARSE